jgi:uncharacterized RDD family membrane protein YckC
MEANSLSEEYPYLSERIQSAFIDVLVLLTLLILFSTLSDAFNEIPSWVKKVFIVILICYEPICMTMGCTLGNFIKKIRVRKFSDSSQKITILQAIIRLPIKACLGWVSFLTIHSNPKRRAIHDLVAGTVMIKKG